MTENSLARPTGRVASQPAARVAPLPKPKSGSTRKITRQLAALSSAAVLAVYAMGYAHTEPAAQQIVAQEGAPSAVTGAPATATPLSQIVRSAIAAASPTPTVAATARYKDGSYVGQGYSRHGDIQATVVVKGGQIVSANVTDCSTRYPCDLVQPMVGEVLQLQGPPVDGISRATDSSMAYYDAVQQALAKAA
jgi:uncharacterized protein with FMN-binding domain